MIAVGALQFFILLVALLRSKALAVIAGPEGVGVIGIIDQIIITVAQFGALGLPFAAMKFMSAAHGVSDDAYRDSFAAFGRILLALAATATVIGGAFILFASPGTGELAPYRGAVALAGRAGRRPEWEIALLALIRDYGSPPHCLPYL